MILGDNIFYGHGLPKYIKPVVQRKHGATVFEYWVKDPERYGVVCFNQNGKAINIVEKPKLPFSNWAVTGLYFYDNQVIDIAADFKPSARGELEITDVNNVYLENSSLHVEKFGRGIAWLDTGTPESLKLNASGFIYSNHRRTSGIESILFRRDSL